MVPRCTTICSTVFASKSECTACQMISTISPATWTPTAAQIRVRCLLRRDMPLPPSYDHRTSGSQPDSANGLDDQSDALEPKLYPGENGEVRGPVAQADTRFG